MMQSIFSAATGLIHQQRRLDVIADNIANVNTAGFKASRLDFKDALYTTMVDVSNPASGVNLQKGLGVIVAGISRDNSGGNLNVTNNMFDLSIEGEGYFATRSPQGEVLYTRSGAFSVSPQADGNYLVTSQGYFVLDNAMNPIRIADDTEITSDGTLISTQTNQPVGTIGVYTFANIGALSAAGRTSFTQTEASGEAFAAGNARIVQGALEQSNVDLAQEMTLMLRTQRAFSLASRALQTADQMDGLAVNMRR